jgi:hypothetical protein
LDISPHGTDDRPVFKIRTPEIIKSAEERVLIYRTKSGRWLALPSFLANGVIGGERNSDVFASFVIRLLEL